MVGVRIDMERTGTLLGRVERRMRRLAKRLLGREVIDEKKYPRRDMWSIGLLRGDSPFQLALPAGRSNPIIDRSHVSDEEAIYVADPFLVLRGGTWNLFFETLAKDPEQPGAEKGVIGLATSKNGVDWRYQKTVLRESFHLSYPHVFEWEGETYMVPESQAANAVRLYRATDFPVTWEFEQNLLDDGEYNDATPFYYQGKWWMFSSSGNPPLHANKLNLFFADHLKGPWREHPESPVVQDDICRARPAGRVIEVNGSLHRFAQECEPHYGTLVRAFEILELTPQVYREREIPESPILGGSGEGWNAKGMHHMDAKQLEDGSWIAAVDGWFWGRATP